MRFTDDSPDAPGSGTIFWGDGASSLASTADNSITRNEDGSYTAWGSHTYAEEAGLTFIVAGNDVGHADHKSFSAPIVVADAPLALVTLTPLSPVQGAATGSVVLATFSDANPAALATDFSATIAWGDQSSSSASGSAGTITPNADGSFSVWGNHTFATAASGLTFRVDIADFGGAATGQSNFFDVIPASTSLQVKVQRVHIIYGTALSDDQLTGTAKTSTSHQLVPGAFSYTSAAGIVLGAGPAQIEQVTFTPSGPFAVTQTTATIDVARATPQVTLNPVNIVYGTALDNALLGGSASFLVNAQTVSVAGTYAFTRAAGKVLTGGVHTRSVTFTPTDLTDYKPVSVRVTVNVALAIPRATANPITITYGADLGGIHVSGTASYVVNGQAVAVAGSFTILGTPGALSVGQHPVSVTFTPANRTDYQAVTTSMTVTVSQATPKVSVDPVNITYGTALNDVQLSGTASYLVNGSKVIVDGTLTYTTDSGSILSGGKHTASATFTPTDNLDYLAVTSRVTVTVAKATPTVTVNAVTFAYGTALKNSQLSGTATYTVNGQTVTVAGTFRYTTAAGTVLAVGANQIEQVTFTPNDSVDYISVQTTVIVNVAKQPGK